MRLLLRSRFVFRVHLFVELGPYPDDGAAIAVRVGFAAAAVVLSSVRETSSRP